MTTKLTSLKTVGLRNLGFRARGTYSTLYSVLATVVLSQLTFGHKALQGTSLLVLRIWRAACS